MAGIYNFTIEQGATTDFEVQYKDGSNANVDLSGYEACLDISTNFSQSAGTVVLSLTSSLGDTYAAASGAAFLSLSGSSLSSETSEGKIGVYIGYERTTELTQGEYLYDLEITNTANEKRTRLLQGKVKISKQVTTSDPL